MKVILTADVKKVGLRGAVVTVADGYAQNVLLPKKLAIPATIENVRRIELEHALASDKKAMQMIMAGKALEAIEGKKVTIAAKANEQGGLFKSIQEKELVLEIKKQLNVELSAEDVHLTEPVKKLGEYSVSVERAGKKTALSLVVIPM